MALTEETAAALVRVLSLAENHYMWTEPARGPFTEEFKTDTYEAITEVRRFLKENGVMTLHELTRQLAARAESG